MTDQRLIKIYHLDPAAHFKVHFPDLTVNAEEWAKDPIKTWDLIQERLRGRVTDAFCRWEQAKG